MPLLALASGCQTVLSFDDFEGGTESGPGGAGGTGGSSSGMSGEGGAGAGAGGGPSAGAGGGPISPGGPELRASWVTAGAAHTCALAISGGLYCWGNNGAGQVLFAGPTAIPRAERVTLDQFDNAPTQVALGASHSCAFGVIVDQVGLVCWGDNTYGQTGVIPGIPNAGLSPVELATDMLTAGVAQIAAGSEHGCLLTGSGPAPLEAQNAVYCWGRNSDAQLGRNDTTLGSDNVLSPVLKASVGQLAGVSAIAAHSDHTCALLGGEGRVFCWGENGAGQTGDVNDLSPGATGVQMTGGVILEGATQIAVGGSHSCAVVGTESVYCWGGNVQGQLGNAQAYATPTPNREAVEVKYEGASLQGVRQIALGDNHSCALMGDETVLCWGSNRDQALGHASPNLIETFTPVLVDGEEGAGPLSNVKQLVAGGGHTCGLLGDGRLLCWGLNTSRQLGTGVDVARVERPMPVLISGSAARSGR